MNKKGFVTGTVIVLIIILLAPGLVGGTILKSIPVWVWVLIGIILVFRIVGGKK